MARKAALLCTVRMLAILDIKTVKLIFAKFTNCLNAKTSIFLCWIEICRKPWRNYTKLIETLFAFLGFSSNRESRFKILLTMKLKVVEMFRSLQRNVTNFIKKLFLLSSTFF